MQFFEGLIFSEPLTVTPEGRWLFVGWAFVFGGILGSFMNVVVYRLPRHMSLSRPGSRCPACGHPIRWHHNVPIAGWMLLGGQCRDCRARISPRYPLVELLMAASIALVTYALCFEPISPQSPEAAAGFDVHLGPAAYFALLVGTLYCAALMELDGQFAPPQMLAGAMAVGLLVGAIWPDVRGVFATWEADAALRGLNEGLLGLVVSLILAAVAWPAWIGTAAPRRLQHALTAASELELVGIFLGARGVSVIAVASFGLYFGARCLAVIWPRAERFGWGASLSSSTLAGLIGWAWLTKNAPRLLESSIAEVCAAAAVIIALLAVVPRLADFARRRFALGAAGVKR